MVPRVEPWGIERLQATVRGREYKEWKEELTSLKWLLLEWCQGKYRKGPKVKCQMLWKHQQSARVERCSQCFCKTKSKSRSD